MATHLVLQGMTMSRLYKIDNIEFSSEQTKGAYTTSYVEQQQGGSSGQVKQEYQEPQQSWGQQQVEVVNCY